MCGIFATLCKENYDTLSKSFYQIKHRGPDSSKLEEVDIVDNIPLVFGFHRLSINDVSSRSMQPMVHNGLYLICNGEIFNHKELEIKYGLNMQTGSDCEVILHLFEYFGRDENALRLLLQELEAEFAFVLYDMRTKTLMAARDPFGVRPLFYSCTGPELCLASELKALRFRKTIKPFKPGSYIYREQQGSFNTTKFMNYFKLRDLSVSFKGSKIENIHKKINTLLKRAVKLRLESDRPIGCFLSGGVDSSLITALVARDIPDLECFTIGLPGSPDIEAARAVVKHINRNGGRVKHHIVHFSIKDGLNAIQEVIRTLETYDITTIRASVPQYLLSKYISENTDIKVLLSGEGSDEVNASYLYNRFAPSANALAEDSRRLVNELYMFDNLRVDRTTAAWGLEVRIPFLCRYYVEFMFSLDPELRMCNNQIEKKLLREAFVQDNLLPIDVLYRKKEAFSDAVSSGQISWYKTISAFVNRVMQSSPILWYDSKKYNHNPPITEEALYYRKLFDFEFENHDNILEHYWLPNWIDTGGDPSATVLPNY